MKNNKFKKFLPGLISIVIIAGMAVQSFATNVDMAAFVKKDKYMTKYYELDFRIDDIEKSLDRLYKFTCTNVKSYGGSGQNATHFMNPWASVYSDSISYHWYQDPIADLTEPKYMRVGVYTALSALGNVSHTHTSTKEIPAQLFKWRSGVELYPHTKVTLKYARRVLDNGLPTYLTEMIMGPFKKFPHITGSMGWNTSTICSANAAYFPGIWGDGSSTTTYYAYGTDTEPTSWTTIGNGCLGQSSVFLTNTTLRAELRDEFPIEQIEQNWYHDPVKSNAYGRVLYYVSAPNTNIESFDKVWIRHYYNNSTATSISRANSFDLGVYNLTTWNNNK